MRYDAAQFGSFDGLDNRRAVMELLERLGSGLEERRGALLRAEFLRSLLVLSGNGFAQKMVAISPGTAVASYFVFVAITGVLGVPIAAAAKALEDFVRQHDRRFAPCGAQLHPC